MRILFFCVLIGFTAAQRGHYAGADKSIAGERYGAENSAAPATTSNFVAPSQGAVNPNSRLSGFAQPVHNYVQPGFGGFGSGFPNQGFQPFQFGPSGFNG